MKKMALVLAGLAVFFDGRLAFANPIYFFGGHSYEYVTTEAGITWGAAKAAAESSGGYLAVVNSAAENAFVASKVDLNPGMYNTDGLGPWLGASSTLADTSDFTWLAAGGGGLVSAGYTNWYSGQPDGAEPQPNGLLYYNGGVFAGAGWGDYSASNTGSVGEVHAYIIEKTPEPASITMLGLGIAGLAGYRLRRRKQAEMA